MSLQVWLPLNGDLHNQGLSGQLNFATTGTISDADGKIGTSKQFTSASAIAPYDFTLANTNAASLCCWIYYNAFPASSSNDWIIHLGSESGYANAILGLITYHSTLLTVMVGGKSDSSFSHGFSLNTWYHIAFTWDNEKGKLYINGQLAKIYTNLTGGTKISSDKISLGANVVNSSTKFNGRLNDVRVYDHCLSPKEVEEIAKGLVLHYKLDDPYVESTYNYASAANSASSPITLSYTTSAYSTGGKNTSLDSNAIYTFSCYLTNTSSRTITLQACYKLDGSSEFTNYENISNSISPGQSGQLIGTLNLTGKTLISGTNVAYRFMGSNKNEATTATYQFFQIEKRGRATPWTLGGTTRPASTTVYDSSGYAHNGTIAGSLTAAAPSPRYDVATVFNAADGRFDFPHFTDSNTLTNEFTFAGWVYRNYTDATTRSFYHGLFEIYLYTDFKLRMSWTHASADLSYNQNNTWAPGFLIPLQEWTHIAITFKNGIIYYYINGVQHGPSDRSNTGQFIRGTRGTPDGHIGWSWIGKLSDIRTYATALTPDQVKELYTTSMSIDSSGNIHARELVEL